MLPCGKNLSSCHSLQLYWTNELFPSVSWDQRVLWMAMQWDWAKHTARNQPLAPGPLDSHLEDGKCREIISICESLVVMGRNVTIAASPWNAIAVRKGPRLLNTLFKGGDHHSSTAVVRASWPQLLMASIPEGLLILTPFLYCVSNRNCNCFRGCHVLLDFVFPVASPPTLGSMKAVNEICFD